jgi:hypothetical protein
MIGSFKSCDNGRNPKEQPCSLCSALNTSGVLLDYRLDAERIVIKFLTAARDFSLFPDIQTGSDTYSAPY